MAKIDDIFEKDIIAKLEAIPDVSALDGFLVHYINDLLKGEGGVSFPCVAAQLDNDSVEHSNDAAEGVITRSLKIVGAVTAKDKALVNRQLNDLVFKVRKALYIEKYNKKATQAKSIRAGNVIYDLPKPTDQYAYFELTVLITYTEKWND